MNEQCELKLPDLGLGNHPVKANVWLVDEGKEVNEGDRLLEVVSSNVSVDIPSPVTGILIRQAVKEGDRLKAGQLLALIEIVKE